MAFNLTKILISSHLVSGNMKPGNEIALRIDQALLQDVLGTLVMLELESMGVERVRIDRAAQYVDHNLLETDNLNGDEHLFLRSACRRFGIWYSRPGNGISHPVHMQRFGRPGDTLIGSDSRTAAAGSMGMFAFGAGGIDVALALTGEPAHLRMPAVFGVKLTGQLPPWVSAKDIILEMLRRHGLEGGTREFLRSVGREDEWRPITAERGADYDFHDEIDLSSLQPLIAEPSSPGNVVAVREVTGAEIYQAHIGSSANPGFRDFAIAATMVRGREVHNRVSFDINPFPPDVAAPVLRKTGPDVSTDDIIPARARVLPYWSNIPKVSEFAFEGIDDSYTSRAAHDRDLGGGHAIVGGANYGQGSSRENAAIAPRYLGAQVVIAKSFARIHWQNLINFGVLPLTFTDASDYERIHAGDTLRIANVEAALRAGNEITATIDGSDDSITLHHNFSERQIKIVMAGGAINWHDNREPGRGASNPAQPASPAAEVQPRKQGGHQ